MYNISDRVLSITVFVLCTELSTGDMHVNMT